ncbi:lipid A biosynthesis lauroyl acyltransferase [Zhengella mangrovi]|uniref:Lipid A biosynthesis lauroyl acyltransferase n=1 Tax=Zhengella mangrovi TaxID=1982044 RepID=A0A2G1QPS6_9HYPH|nr:lipid A biosynthesis lauroyl acyltransferase [Zhengella mangrovi]PHP67479.1 lipid A biosynthesis lauroyl acyltransferase [Zhengella mangrovi]
MKMFVYRVLRRLKFVEYWIVARLTLGLLWIIKLLPAEGSLAALEWLARRFGPLSGRHRVALDNLRHAFPEKTEADLQAIALDMWGNMGRLMGEYVFLDDIFDYDPAHPESGRVTVDGAEVFEKLLRDKDRPAIFFTAHMGNFELLPVAAMTYGLEVTALFRPPNNPYLAERLLAARHTAMGALVPSRAGASFALARVLENGGKAGMLVDQFFIRGRIVEFFGREASTSPLLGKLARQFDCPIHPARCVRLPGGRFHLTLFDAIDPVRDASGRVDVHGVTQQVTSIVEDWIRQDPGQWMWFHKRWKNSPRARR